MTDPRVDAGLFRELLRVTEVPFRELAVELEVSHTTIGRWASGESRPSVAQVREAVRYLAREPDRLRERAAVVGHLVGALARELEDYERMMERLVGAAAGGYDVAAG